MAPGDEKSGDVEGSAVEEEGHVGEIERQARVMATDPDGIYERFRRGLLEYHSEVGVFMMTSQSESADNDPRMNESKLRASTSNELLTDTWLISCW